MSDRETFQVKTIPIRDLYIQQTWDMVGDYADELEATAKAREIHESDQSVWVAVTGLTVDGWARIITIMR